MARSNDLDDALGRLTDVLADVQASTDDYCRACYSDADGTALAGPLERIPDNLLTAVAAEVPDHFDDFGNLYRKLTPRIMPLLVYDELHIDVDRIANRLTAAGCWDTWPADEREAMLAVCRAWWNATLTTYPRQPEAYEVVTFLATTPVPLTEWLETWTAQPPGPADHTPSTSASAGHLSS